MAGTSGEATHQTARVLDGKAAAAEIREELRAEAERLAALGRRPGLAAVLVGDDEPSKIYVGAKQRAAEAAGLVSRLVHLPGDTTQTEVLDAVEDLSADDSVHGIIVQLPLPPAIDPVAVQEAISPSKDVDALHPWNQGRVLRGDPLFLPCTPAGIVELLQRQGVKLAGSEVVIVGRGMLVGRPLALLLAEKARANATVTLCHTGTVDMAAHTRQADVLVVAAGQHALITPDMVKPGAAVVDAGQHRTPDGLQGDVHPAVAEVAGALTPVPGGVGPMTVALLLSNTVTAAREAV
jgi:methylenetetrahydrofolate dehydrogenase (NADP+)/methenyltetrahydrofolate cyclohydrolase